MASVHLALLLLHVVSGTAGLAAFWVAALAPRGGPLHRRAGSSFTAAAVVLAGSALLLCAVLALDLAAVHPGQPAGAVRGRAAFLTHVSLLVLAPLATGRAALRRGRFIARLERALQALLLATSSVALAAGLASGSPLPLAMGAIGLSLAIRGLVPQPRLAGHVHGMISTGIALHTGFLVTAVGRAVPLPWIAWILPGIVGGACIAAVTARLRRREAA